MYGRLTPCPPPVCSAYIQELEAFNALTSDDDMKPATDAHEPSVCLSRRSPCCSIDWPFFVGGGGRRRVCENEILLMCVLCGRAWPQEFSLHSPNCLRTAAQIKKYGYSTFADQDLQDAWNDAKANNFTDLLIRDELCFGAGAMSQPSVMLLLATIVALLRLV